MRNRFDQFAKRLALEVMKPLGRTHVHHEIAADAQHADVVHEPDPTRRTERRRLGVLGRLIARPCLMELFGHTPTEDEAHACVGKFMVHLRRHRRARRKDHLVRNRRSPRPLMWVISSGRPTRLLHDLVRRPGWPEGFYFLNAFLRVAIVVARELPRDRQTLLLRLLAAGPLLPSAVEDLAALPSDAYERTAASQILLELRSALEKKPHRSTEEQEIFVSTQNLVEKLLNEGKQLGRKEGRRAGRKEGLVEGRQEGLVEGRQEGLVEGRQEGLRRGQAEGRRAALRRVLEGRGLTIEPDDERRIKACTRIETLDRWLVRAINASSAAEALRDER